MKPFPFRFCEVVKPDPLLLLDFWKEKPNKGRAKGTSSKLLEVVLEEKKREIMKEWINSGRIKNINSYFKKYRESKKYY